MKKTLMYLILVFGVNMLNAQDTVKLKDLAVPSSPAFMLADVTPSLVQNPNTPKSFILGVAQSFQQSNGFPLDYSAEFTPFWMVKQTHKDIYDFLGLKTQRSGKTVTEVSGENHFAGLKFTTVSLAFMTKDLIPDTIDVSQKIFSIGARTTIFKIHLPNYAANLNARLKYWHETALSEMDSILQIQLAIAGDDPIRKKEIQDSIKAKYSRQSKSLSIAKEINDMVNEKPIFSWDVAAAYALYGINDSAWKTGRSGIWTTLSSYIPLAFGKGKPDYNYFNINFLFRYLLDNYQKDEKGLIAKNHSIDLGGKAALELNHLSIGIESLYRYSNGLSNTQNRTVGLLIYKIADNLYLTGAFGKNFDSPNKLISLFQINWGIGSETGSLPY